MTTGGATATVFGEKERRKEENTSNGQQPLIPQTHHYQVIISPTSR
jgi:hypothetical protein